MALTPNLPADVARIIQLAVAPVFLLSGVGVTLTMLTSRLARVVDRARALEQKERDTHANEMHVLGGALRTLERRARLLGRAIALCTICALLVSMVVVTLFLGAFVSLHVSLIIATLFIVAMLSFIGGLLLFLREVFVATRALRIGLTGTRDTGA
jgi:uncharacterized membrane protein YGL010W